MSNTTPTHDRQSHPCLARLLRRAGITLLMGFLSLVLSSFALLTAPLEATEHEEMHRQILAGQEAMYQGQFEQALQQFTALTQAHPDDPRGHFFLALTYRWLTRIDPSSKTYQRHFERTIKQAIRVAEALLEDTTRQAEALLYLAAAYGYRGEYYNFLKHSWSKAYDDGVKMQKYLKKAEKLSDDLIDMQLGFGLYNYYAYRYRDKIGWWRFLLSLPKGDREKGIRLLETVRQQGVYARVEAWYFLIEIYKDEKESIAKAIALCEDLHQTYPNQPFFHTLLAGIYHKGHKWQQSVSTARDILAQAPANPYYSDYLIYQAHYLIGEGLFFLGQYDQALEKFDAIIASNPQDPEYLLPWSHLRRGTIYNLTGHPDAAKAEYNLVLEMQDVQNVHELAKGLLKNHKK
ncbi:tetratricopeptide repeat protein [candidate division KSB3 bacterium]|uniref:Tetratricopeptide repeat protein n=1 Tax=candidate division KSB3 bacterium TaxID=2044937 RepID=A0A9D5JZF8_9BACT|nr:tetratricopeptide repeat protein [candidate division KSB3 bacterium]MBD3326943.1 tetratricopeptide repeat protein [candidate division KSB3 bacterium]